MLEQADATADHANRETGAGLLGRLGAWFAKPPPANEDAAALFEGWAEGATALALMRNLAVKLTPPAFEIFYAHCTGSRHDLSDEINRMREAREPFAPETIAELHERFFGAERDGRAVYEASRQVERLLSLLQDELTSASTSTEESGRAISALSHKLEGHKLDGEERGAAVREVVAGIVAELAGMRMSMNRLERRVVQGSTEIALMRERLEAAERDAHRDPLTGLVDRKLLDLTLRRSSTDDGDRFCLLLLDMDEFERVNAAFGRPAGDLLLKRIGQLIGQSIKARDLAARYEGQAFAILLAGTGLDAGLAFAESLRRAIAAVELTADGVGAVIAGVTASIGLAERRAGEPPQRLLGRAERALAHAKGAGRNSLASERDIEVHGRPKGKPAKR